MTYTECDIAKVREKFEALKPVLDERSIRMWCATEAKAYGRGGIVVVHKATGVSRPTIIKGCKELQNPASHIPQRLRRKGGGRKKISDKQPLLLQTLNAMIDPLTRGDPESPLRWTSKSTIKLAQALREKGFSVTQKTVYNLLKKQEYSMKSNRKRHEGTTSHPDRDAQFQWIHDTIQSYQARGCPALSVDTKKKENVGLYKNQGQEWSAKGEHTDVQVHDFVDKQKGKVAPYGVYDVVQNEGWVSVGISSDTAEFAVQSIRTWWYEMGQKRYQDAPSILLMADCGGSNGNRVHLWKYELQHLADEIDKTIAVCHFPPGTSKWNKIEHRLFCCITQNWRARPLIDLQTVVELIGSTTTKTGLVVRTKVDSKIYQKGRRISKKQMEELIILGMPFHPEWNYVIHPRMNYK